MPQHQHHEQPQHHHEQLQHHHEMQKHHGREMQQHHHDHEVHPYNEHEKHPHESDTDTTTTTMAPGRMTTKSSKSRRKSRHSGRDTESTLSHEMHNVGPCTVCHIDLEFGVRIFAVVHIVYCVVVLTVHFMELMNVLGVVDIDFKYMTPTTKDRKDNSGYLMGFEPVENERNVNKAWAPTVLCCVTDSLQLIAGFVIIPATFRSSQKFCGIWLIATYFLYFPHMFYFGFAVAVGTSWVSLILQVIDSLLYTPYAIWIVRAYMDSLGYYVKHPKRVSVTPTPNPALSPQPIPPLIVPALHTPPPLTTLPLPRSSLHPHHAHLDVVKEKKHVSHSDASRSPSSSSAAPAPDYDHAHKILKKSIQQPIIETPNPNKDHKPMKPKVSKADQFDELSKRLF